MSYTITSVTISENIGDSLQTVNKNYDTLTTWINDLQKNYNDVYLPIYNYYLKYSDRMDNAINTAQTLSATWDDFQTTVETHSAKWIQPVTIFYPNLIGAPFNDNNLNQVKYWLLDNFPISNIDGSVNYVENQQFIINCHTFKNDFKVPNIHIFLRDYTYCFTHNSTIYAYCADIWANNYVYCSNGGASCGYARSCSNSATSDCYYLTPYFYNLADKVPIGSVDTHAISAYGKIEANVYATFNDRFESSAIISISFRVIQCDWVFEKYIT
jgi:hypothetical protein